MMPGEIKKAKVGDYCQITSSKRIYSSDYESTGVPFYRGKEIIEKQRGNLTVSTELFISEGKFRDIEFKFGVPKAGDLLLTSVGTLGIPYVVRSGEKFYFKDGNLTWFKNFKHLDSKFLYYWLLSPLGKAQLSRSTIGSSQPALTIVLLKQMEIELPSLLVQQKITAVLSAYDDLIENNTRRIAILEEMTQALYREWFVHFRFLGHEDVPLVEVDGMQIPEGWQVVKLQAIAEVNARNIGKTNSPAIINYIDISSVSTGIINQTALIPFSEAPSRARRLVENGDIIWSTVRPNRKSYALIIEPRPNTVVSTGFAVISATQIPYSYLYHAVTAEKFVDYLTNHAKGAAYPAVSQDDFMNAEILLAPTELLKQFNHVVQDMVILKHTLLTKNANLRQTRDLLLPRLISGELDVSHIPRRDVALQRLYHPNTP